MAYVNTWEERGIQKGMKKGITLGEATLLERQLTRRFGPLPGEVRDRLASATSEQLQTWGDRVLEATSLTEVFSGH